MLKTLRIIGVAAGWASAVVSSAILLGWLAGAIVTDRWWWSQWLAWIPTGVALAAGIAGWLAAWRPAGTRDRRRRRVWVWSAVVLALACLFFLIENRPLRRAPSVPPDALRIVHWNVSPEDPRERHAIDLALDLDAHVTILTDAYLVPWREQARERLGDDAHLFSQFPFAFISTLPITRVRRLAAVDDIYAMLISIDAAGTSIGREISILAIDLPSDLSLSRMKTAQRLRGLLDESLPNALQGDPDLVLGDFNTTRGSASLSVIAPGMRHAWRDAGRGWSATFPRSWAMIHIDHVFVNPATLRAVDYEVIELSAARHRAQRVVLEPLDRR